VIRKALASAGVAASEVDVVEAHGTGTALGDPIEAGALLATYGQDRAEGRPLWLGSIKSNIGHAQSAAGVAGVIKMVMAMRHGFLPKTLHVDAPSPHVDWSSGAIELLVEGRKWTRAAGPRRAGVSSFGVSGTNAHLILEEEPPEEQAGVRGLDPVPGGLVPWVVSGRNAVALAQQADKLHDFVVADPGLDIADVGWSLVSSRSGFAHRAVVLGRDQDELLSGLALLGDGAESAKVVRGVAGDPGGVVFVFPGQGSEWAGMGRELYDTFPVFAQSLDECAAAVAEWVDWSLLDVLRAVPGAPALDRVEVIQPALFATMVSLAGLWRSWGVEPAAVMGHSQGEIAAAVVAGALSLKDGARVVTLRSRAGAALDGGVASVQLSAAEAGELLARWPSKLCIAAVNAPTSVVVSGSDPALGEFLAHCKDADVRARRVQPGYASHSPRVEAIRDEMAAILSGITPQSSPIPFCSTVTGDRLDTRDLDPGYWYRNAREPVRFEQAIRTLAGHGHRVFIEVSPHPVLIAAVTETIEDLDDAAVLSSSRRDLGEVESMVGSLAQLHVLGGAVDWDALFGARRRVDLPTYAFQRRRYWLNSSSGLDSAPAAVVAKAHPAEPPADDDHPGALPDMVSALPDDEAQALVLDQVLQRIAVVLGRASGDVIDPDQDFRDLGFNSLLSVELSKRLSRATGLRLRANLVLLYPTARLVAGHIMSSMADRERQ
jgi:acyl transferase domain-containing protein